MRDSLKLIAGVSAIVALITFGCWYYVVRLNECRRLHPLWYCIGDK